MQDAIAGNIGNIIKEDALKGGLWVLPLLPLELLQEILLHPLHGLAQTRLHLVELRHHQAQLAQHVVQVVVHLRHPVAGEDDIL